MKFYPLEELNRLHEGYQRAFKVAGKSLLLIHHEGQTHLIDNRCPHMDAPLVNATQVPGGMLRCRAHGIEFNLGSGKACGPLADVIEELVKYTLVLQGTKIGVEF